MTFYDIQSTMIYWKQQTSIIHNNFHNLGKWSQLEIYETDVFSSATMTTREVQNTSV